MKHTIFFLVLLFSATLFASDKSKTVILNVSGMTCDACVNTVEKALKKVNGVETVKVILKEKKATITLASNSKTTPALLVKAVSDAGFGANEGKAMPKTMMKKSEPEGCGEGCCGDDCESDAKPAKAKKTEMKKS